MKFINGTSALVIGLEVINNFMCVKLYDYGLVLIDGTQSRAHKRLVKQAYYIKQVMNKKPVYMKKK